VSRERFYAERDRRTVEYGLVDPFEDPVGIVVSKQAAESVAGQVAALGLINMAARLHRALRVVVPDVPLMVSSMVGASSLLDEAGRLVLEIDPFNDLVVTAATQGAMPTASVGVGRVAGVARCLSADRYAAFLGSDVPDFSAAPSTVLGAGASACLGAAALAGLSLGRDIPPARLSMWELTEARGEPGPDDLAPLELGTVAVVGGGAVACALAYWTQYVAVVDADAWLFVDGDLIELHNTNRGLGFFSRHAGWPEGEPGGEPAKKAPVVAGLLRADYFEGWYDAWVAARGPRPDLVVPLANGPGLRAAIAERGEPILVHATTSPMWTAELHRHVAEPDGCIVCRLPERSGAPLVCSTSPLPDSSGNDAALPFLSAGAGLLLLAGLVHLGNGRLATFDANHWQAHLDLVGRRVLSSRHWGCTTNCTLRRNLTQDLRRRLPRSGRWAHLD
jgi:hypothetical protein